MKKEISFLTNPDKNSLFLSVTENSIPVLDNIPKDIQTYQLIGELFKSIGTLSKDNLITIFFNFKKVPFSFILLILKINIVAKSNIHIFIKDKNTLDFINDFKNINPTELKSFFNGSDIEIPDTLKEDTSDTLEETCEIKLSAKISKLVKEVNENQEVIKLNNYLKDSNIEDLDINNNILKTKETLEILNNMKNNEEFNNLLEDNLIPELTKLNIKLF